MPLAENNIFNISAQETCLCTVLLNPTSAPQFVLVPWHGTTIGAESTYAFIGGLDAWLQKKRYRTRKSFTNALTTGKLVLLQLPLPHAYYTAAGNYVYKMLTITDNAGNPALLIADPCWKPT